MTGPAQSLTGRARKWTVDEMTVPSSILELYIVPPARGGRGDLQGTQVTKRRNEVNVISTRSIVSVSICLIGLMLFIPAVSAGGIADAHNQTHVTEIRDRIVNTSHVTEVMMQGAIAYIDQISNSSGITALTATRDDYLSVAGSIPSIENNTELRSTEMDLRQIEHLFFNQTETAVTAYNGTRSGLKESINVTLAAAGLNESRCGPHQDHAPGFAGNGTARPDFAGNGTSRPDFAGNETARPDFAGNDTARPDFAGDGTARPDFAGNETARPAHLPDVEINGTAPAGSVSCPADTSASMPGNRSVGRHNHGVNPTTVG